MRCEELVSLVYTPTLRYVAESKRGEVSTHAVSSPLTWNSASLTAAPSDLNWATIFSNSAEERERVVVGSTGEGTERVERVERDEEVMRRVELTREGGRERGEAVVEERVSDMVGVAEQAAKKGRRMQGHPSAAAPS